MKYKILETEKGSIAIIGELEHPVENSGDFLDLLFSVNADTLALEKGALNEKFFDLKTGVAGEFMQKVLNYHKRLIIIGDFQNVQSNSLKSLIYESNHTGKIVFSSNIEEGIMLLK